MSENKCSIQKMSSNVGHDPTFSCCIESMFLMLLQMVNPVVKKLVDTLIQIQMVMMRVTIGIKNKRNIHRNCTSS